MSGLYHKSGHHPSAFLCDSEATSWVTVLGVEELDVVGLRSIAFLFGKAEREDNQDGMTATASLEEPALLKEYEGLLMLTPWVFDLGEGAKFLGLFKDWNFCSWVSQGELISHSVHLCSRCSVSNEF